MRNSTATFTWNGHEHTLLSETTAMACPGFSLPAIVACPGMVACGPEHICWGCYHKSACMHNRALSMPGRPLRLDGAHDQEQPAGIDRYHGQAITDTGSTYFRPHDSGDLWSVEYANAWYKVRQGTPHVRYWFPTRSYHLLWIDAIRRLASLPNVVVRPSALEWNAPAPSVRGLQKGTTAVSAHKHMADGHTMCPRQWLDMTQAVLGRLPGLLVQSVRQESLLATRVLRPTHAVSRHPRHAGRPQGSLPQGDGFCASRSPCGVA